MTAPDRWSDRKSFLLDSLRTLAIACFAFALAVWIIGPGEKSEASWTEIENTKLRLRAEAVKEYAAASRVYTSAMSEAFSDEATALDRSRYEDDAFDRYRRAQSALMLYFDIPPQVFESDDRLRRAGTGDKAELVELLRKARQENDKLHRDFYPERQDFQGVQHLKKVFKIASSAGKDVMHEVLVAFLDWDWGGDEIRRTLQCGLTSGAWELSEVESQLGDLQVASADESDSWDGLRKDLKRTHNQVAEKAMNIIQWNNERPSRIVAITAAVSLVLGFVLLAVLVNLVWQERRFRRVGSEERAADNSPQESS